MRPALSSMALLQNCRIIAVECEARTKRLADALSRATGRQIEVRVVIDPSVVGGAVAKIGDEIFDGSVRSRLLEAREHLTGTTTGSG